MEKTSNSEFESISPSAKSLLLTKALTSIPFSKEAIELIIGNENENAIYEKEKLSSLSFILKLIHFEKRYWSIDEALSMIDLENILEFSSGYSFRGLDWSKNKDIHYIDTDLPQLMENKRILVEKLAERYCVYSINTLFMRDLNVLDEEPFFEIIKLLPSSPIAIVNEGLLMYFDEEKKRTLCSIIHKILSERGGYWVTADVYIKKEEQSSLSVDIFDQQGHEFLTAHQVEENKFESFESAEEFFTSCGFDILEKVEVPSSKVISRKYLAKMPKYMLAKLKRRKKTRETWILKCKTEKNTRNVDLM